MPAIGGVPHLQQVTGRAAGGGDDRVAGPGVLLQQTDQLALGENGVRVGDDVGGLRPQRVQVGGTVGIERGRAHQLPFVLRPLDLIPPGRHHGHVAPGQLVGEGLQGQPRVAEDRRGAEPVGVARVEVDAGETHFRRGEQRVRRRGEVGQAGPNADDEVGLRGELVGGGVALEADAAQLPPGAGRDGALAREGLRDRDPRLLGDARKLAGRARVVHAAPGDDQRALRLGEQRGQLLDLCGVRGGTANDPLALVEERQREVVGVGLHVLRERDDRGAGVDRVDQYPHGRGQGGEQLLGPGDPVEEPRHRAERVVDAGVGLDRVLQLLQDRALAPGGVRVAGQQQHRQPVDGRQRGAGDHVERARADGRRDREGGPAEAGLRVAGREVHERLLVAALDERQVAGVLVEGLPEPGDIAVTEDAQRGRDEPAPFAVGDAVLPGQVAHEGLGRGEPNGGHGSSSWGSGVVSVAGHHGRPCRMTVFSSVISVTAVRKPSLPIPEAFSPP